MNTRPISWILLACSLMAVASIFLPWVHAGKGFLASLAPVAELLKHQTDSKLSWQDFVLPNEMQWEHIQTKPFHGTTGWQIFLELRENKTRQSPTQYFVGQFLGAKPFPEKAHMFLTFPLLVATLALLGFFLARQASFQMGVGIFLISLYLVIRWRLAMTEAPRLALQIDVGTGFWLAVYACLTVGLLMLLRAFLPK